jgi:hypothetical protein
MSYALPFLMGSIMLLINPTLKLTGAALPRLVERLVILNESEMY